MKSMTGYAKIIFESDIFRVKIELKSVNNKYLNVNLKSPYTINFLEGKIRTVISGYISRGYVEARVDVEDKRENNDMLEYNEKMAKNYINIINKMENEFLLKAENKLELLIKNPSIISKKEEEIDEQMYSEMVISNLEKALVKLNEMRTTEGERLKDYLVERLTQFEKVLSEIKGYKDSVVDELKNKLLTRINNIEKSIEFKEEDILREVILYADRSDISEEVSRLDSHIKQFKIEVNNENTGKKIDFLLQEMFREINTLGVKSNNYEISKRAVECKNELEKIREQIQNIE